MIRHFFLLLLLMGVAAGCAPVKPGQHEEPPVDFLSEGIANAIDIVSHRAERLPSGHVDVILICLSKEKKKPVWMDWKVVFYDRHGIPVEESEWHTEQLLPKREMVLRAGSIGKDIERFRFLLRSPS